MIPRIAQWCEALQGRAPAKDALASIAVGLDVEAIALTRTSGRDQSVKSSVFVDQKSGDRPVPALSRSFVDAVLGAYISEPEPGSVWVESLTEFETDPALERFQRQRRLNELAIIPLSTEANASFFLELHFTGHRGTAHHSLINMTAPTLSDTWARRRPGLMTELVLSRQPAQTRDRIRGAILSVETPARLSRAEFRVCLLLSRGLSNARICETLQISDSTFRTHLRNIYAKVDVHSQSELLFELLAGPVRAADPQRGVA